MAWIDKYLSKEDLQKIEETISRVEEKTSGEIVPVIVRRSSAVGHVPLMLTLILTLCLIAVEFPFSEWLWVKPWVYLWPAVVVVLYLFSRVLARSLWVQKILVSEADEQDQVHARAQLEFYLNTVHRTSHGTGILIFVSVMEKKAVVLGDQGISEKLPKETWDALLNDLRQHLKAGRWGEGFVQAIESCGAHLQTHFPIGANPPNELKNHLIVKD